MVGLLRGQGHTLAEIRGYTLRQAQGFLDLGFDFQRLTLKNASNATRAAYHADKAAYRKFMKSLDG